MRIIRYADGGHSWFKVSRKLLQSLNILEKISTFSKQLGNYVYLEEDCDFAVFAKAYLKTEQLSYQLVQENFNIVVMESNHSKVRTYSSFDKDFIPFTWQTNKEVSLYGKKYTTLEKNGKKCLMADGSTYRLRPYQALELQSC